MYQRTGVFGKATATVARTRIQKAVANALVSTDAPAHTVNVSTQAIGQQRHFVHERNARGQHRVGCVFGQFGADHIHPHRSVVVSVERHVQPCQHLPSPVAFRRVRHPDDDTVWPHEIVNGRAFFQELRVGHHRK